MFPGPDPPDIAADMDAPPGTKGHSGAGSLRRLCGALAEYKLAVVLAASCAVLVAGLAVESPAERPEAAKGAAVLVVVALWWITEVVPLAVTSLLPMVLYPLLGVMKAKTLAVHFFNSTSFLFAAGFLIGIALERWGVHRRVAYAIVETMSARIELLIAGFMLAVWGLSMWISNTAAIFCMLPVASSFLDALPAGHERFQSGFLLSIGYSATIGGIATPVGTPTNSVALGLYEDFWPGEDELSFSHFVGAALPLSAGLLVLTWLGMCSFYLWWPRAGPAPPVDRAVFRSLRAGLGKWQYEEIVICADFLALILAWFTASPIAGFPGWKASIASELHSSSIGLMFTLPLFFVPCSARLPQRLRALIGEDRCLARAADGERPQYLLDWKSAKQAFKWEILFVFGGGYLLAKGTRESKLVDEIASALSSLEVSQLAFIGLIALVVCFVTEFVSNMATTQIFGPIVVAIAQTHGFDPLVCLLCTAFASSFAFMLPMAGGPNMAVYSSGKISLQFMAGHGLLLNLAAVAFGGLYMGLVMPSILGDSTGLPSIE